MDSYINEGCLSQALSAPWVRIESLDMFDDMGDAKCFLGWSGDANVLLGSRRMSFDVKWTSLEHRTRTLHKKGMNTVLQAGVTGGTIQAGVQVGANWEFASNRLHWEPSRDYAMAITDASQKIALIFDAPAQRSRVVPQLSLLLHLCHVYFYHLNSQSSVGDPIPFAQPSPDGAAAARAAFTDQGDLVVFRLGANDVVALRNIVVDICIGLVNSAKTREDPRRLLAPVFYGAELGDIVNKAARSDLREVPAGEAAQGWLPLVGAVDFDGCLDCFPTKDNEAQGS